MPTNLPPEYFAAEQRYKRAATPQEKIAALEELISTIPKHKGTDKLRADLRKRLSQLREEAVRKKRGGKGDLHTVEKQGAAQAALVGFPNAGKSSVLQALTNAHPVIADYPLSTVAPLAGMMPFEDIQFQLVDLPPIGNESTDGWVSGILRNADLLLLVVDLSDDPGAQAELLLDQLKEWNIPLLSGIWPGIQNKGVSRDEEEGVPRKPVVIAANKSDLPGTGEELGRLREHFGALYPLVRISALRKEGLEDLRRAIFSNARVIRVYSKEPGKEPDRSTPFTLPEGSTVIDLAERIHKDFADHFKYACIWGSAKFDGQRVQKDYVLHDRDVVEYHMMK